MTTKQWATKTILKRSFLLLCIAAFLVWCCIFVWKDDMLLFNIGTIAITVALFGWLLYRSRVLHILCGKDQLGKVVNLKPVTLVDNKHSRSIRSIRAVCGTKLTVETDKGKMRVYTLFPDQFTPGIFRIGDRIMLFKGAKYPHNLTRKGEIFICPFCARNLFEDKCPDCCVKF